MENENIVVRGIMQKNKIALVILIVGIVLAFASFLVAYYIFDNGSRYAYYGFGNGGYYSYYTIYRGSFFDFYIDEFLTNVYSYMLLVGVIATIVGFIIKKRTENCEITVFNNRIVGRVKAGKTSIEIPLNQITALHTCSFNGVSIVSIFGVSNFYLIENRDEVMRAISYLLANPQ